MNILLTGSRGFIGSYFINHYQNRYNIKKFSFQTNNLSALNLNNIDIVIHLSALVHQMGGAEKSEYYNINVVQTIKLANKAKECGVKQFIFMSTVKVYGEETDIPYNENSICSPIDDYGKSKLQAEEELRKLSNKNFKVSIIRTPIVYGYGVKANIKNLISLIERVPILPLGDINNRRSMIYIGNLCYLIDTIIKKNIDGIFLASDNEVYSTKELIKEISNVLNKKVYLIKIPFFKEIIKTIKPSFYKRLYKSLEVENNITKKTLNLNNPYSIKDGIELMIKGKNDR